MAKYAFIGGIPASGKSYLAKKIAEETGATHINLDELRCSEMIRNPELKPWVEFFINKDEVSYWQNTNCEEDWENLKKQSEAFWPTILNKIKDVQNSGKSAIFEAVNILPHLAHRDLDFKGVFLLGESFEIIFERNKKDPRWGKTEELQRIEADRFFNCESKMYEQEAEKYGFKAFNSAEEAEEEIKNLLEK
jgi:predicted kinase